ncbi:MFS transporter [Aquincola sp. MAHUQ-54]|uniref:MFS transporter n=1 Tax=Aquincola agrisoli TaxID=3119538 RepID=A0AAW9QD19_9BURK
MTPDAPPPPLPPRASTLAPLSRPVFRMLWIATVTANVCMWMNDVAAAWLMTQLAPDPVWVALVQTAATLPVFLLGLPSGAMADIVDRRHWFMFTQLWVASTAVLLSVLAFAGALNAPLLLLLVFANGIGLAMRWPVFAAIVPELVPRHELTSAMALNAIAMNASRIAGPILAGAILTGLGSAWVFALNATLSLGAAGIIWRWRNTPRASALPGERFVGAMRVGVQYVSQSLRMRVILLRIFVFFLHSTALLALMPLVAQQSQGGGAGTFTLLLACMGGGAVATALMLPRIREKLTRDDLIFHGTLANAIGTVIVALSPSLWLTAPAMALAGAGWISVANSLTLSAQLALPDWVRARGMATYQTALMAGSAGGAALWGQVASLSSLRGSLLASAAAGLVLLVLLRGKRVESLADDDLTPQRVWASPTPALDIDPHAGPVMVTVAYDIDPADADAFSDLMRESRRSRLQQGALSWGLFRDHADPRRWLEYYVDESWVEHLRRFDRVTAVEVALRARRLAFHRGESPPKVSRYIGQEVER